MSSPGCWISQAGGNARLSGTAWAARWPVMLADKRPDLVARLVLAEANLDAGGGGFSRGIASVSEGQFVAEGFATLLHDIRESLTPEDQSAAVALGMWQVAAPRGLHRSAFSLVAGTQPSWRERLYTLDMPRLYLFGEHSLPDQDLEVLPVHGVDTAIVPGAGHGMVWENPDGFAATVLAFMGSARSDPELSV
jgi:pimeloyl-ACP methyl ester carboxylesterase